MCTPHLAVCLHLFIKCTFSLKTYWKQLPLCSSFPICHLLSNPLRRHLTSVSLRFFNFHSRQDPIYFREWLKRYTVYLAYAEKPPQTFHTVTFNAKEAACGLAFISDYQQSLSSLVGRAWPPAALTLTTPLVTMRMALSDSSSSFSVTDDFWPWVRRADP